MSRLEKRAQAREKLLARECKKGGFKGRINAKCIECLFDPYQEGSWRKQVANCTCFDCPLFPIRPKPGKKTISKADDSTGARNIVNGKHKAGEP